MPSFSCFYIALIVGLPCGYISSSKRVVLDTNFLLSFLKVRMWLEEILWDKKYGMDVYRCKGVLSIVNSDQLHTLQVHFNA